MRRTGVLACISAGSVVLGMTLSASAFGGCGCGQPSRGNIASPACGAPSYGSMTPGCCQCPPSPCDNVWDGYCQEKNQRGCGWWSCRPVICVPARTYVVPSQGCQTTRETCGSATVSEPMGPRPAPNVPSRAPETSWTPSPSLAPAPLTAPADGPLPGPVETPKSR